MLRKVRSGAEAPPSEAFERNIDLRRALNLAEKQAVAQYGSSDSGASLGDILGAALNKAREGQ